MNILQLIYVLEVAKYHNVSKAASRLYLSQSALSQQISRLEKELGYELFSRASHGLYLTERGRQFCDAAQPAVDSWQRFQRSIGFENSRCKKHLRIAMGSRVYSNGLFHDIASFFDNLPDLEVTFITEAGFDYLAGLKDGSIDLALDRLPPHSLMNDCPPLDCCNLIGESQCVLMSPMDPRSTLEYISPRELQGSAMITGLEGSIEDRTLKETFKNHGISPGRVYRSDGIHTVINLICSGKGVAIGPRSFASYYGVAAVPLNPPGLVYLSFICPADRSGSPEIVMFRKYLLDICGHRF